MCNILNIFRSYDVRKIMNTNLILLVVNKDCEKPFSTESEHFDTIPQEIVYENYNNSLSCYKALHSLTRCRPKTACIRTHPDVSITI